MLHFAPWKTVFILAIVVAGFLFTLPNLLSEQLPSWLPKDKISLGLDLQGGVHMLLEADTRAVIRERLESVVEDTRLGLREARIGYTGLGIQGDEVHVRVRDSAQIDKAEEILKGLAIQITDSLLAAGSSDIAVKRLQDGLLVVNLTENGIASRLESVMGQSLEIVRRRIDELGTREASIQRQGSERIIVQVPGLTDPGQLKEIIGKTAKLTFRLVNNSVVPEQALTTRPPVGSEILYSEDEPPVPYVIEKRIMVSGENLVDAQPGFDQRNGEPVVTFRFDNQGARRFGDVTAKNVGRPFAIVLDDKVISAPVIQEPILGGSGQISGTFTVQETNNLAILLRAGALPAPLNVIEERTVGPGLGKDSIKAGTAASIGGAIAVFVYMFASYGFFSFFAAVPLIINVMLIIGALSMLGATLTLPGIAGIVLTMGMAVDANVLVFERVREELRSGKTPINALDAGFSRAIGTIMDANLTTLISGLVLFFVGSGPVRGFAVTLSIGIVTSVFSTVSVTRLMIATWVRWRRPKRIEV
jgi:protein-export membrane protein SecD